VFRQLGARIDGDAEAWVDGDVGFVVDVATLSLARGQSVPVRWTTVLYKERGGWKGVHQHASYGVPTDDPALRAFNDAVQGAVTQT
jgi:ketosteroid isomerase-like protein